MAAVVPRRTRIAVVGAGLVGRAHLAAIRADPALELAAIVDPVPVPAELAGDAPRHATLADLLRFDRPDGIVLATPNGLHVPQALECVAADIAVLVEKPIAVSVAEGRALIAAIDARGARVLVGHHRAHSPIMAAARTVVASGRLGRLVAVTGSALFCKPGPYFDEAPWRREPGGGPILINLIHEIHNLRMLCGEIVAVQALASSAVRGFAVEDTATIGLCFDSGALGSFVLSDTAAAARSWEQTTRENPAFAVADDEDCYLVAGTTGSLSIPSMRLRTWPPGIPPSWTAPSTVERLPIAPDDPIRRQMAHFGAVVRGEAAPLVSARDGLRNLGVVEAIRDAAATGRTVAVADLVAPRLPDPSTIDRSRPTQETSMASESATVVPAPPQVLLPVVGDTRKFPVRRIYCVGRNYVEHAKEMGFTGREPPFFFLKPADAIVYVPEGETGRIPYPVGTKDLHHEIELVAAIGKSGAGIKAGDAKDYVYGWAVGLDMTRRDLQGEAKKQGRPWEIGKAYDKSAPIGPIYPAAKVGWMDKGRIALEVNGKIRQQSDVDKLIWNIGEVIEHLSSLWRLEPGDLIFTGTPEGVAAVGRGDLLSGVVEKVGGLKVEIDKD